MIGLLYVCAPTLASEDTVKDVKSTTIISAFDGHHHLFDDLGRHPCCFCYRYCASWHKLTVTSIWSQLLIPRHDPNVMSFFFSRVLDKTVALSTRDFKVVGRTYIPKCQTNYSLYQVVWRRTQTKSCSHTQQIPGTFWTRNQKMVIMLRL